MLTEKLAAVDAVCRKLRRESLRGVHLGSLRLRAKLVIGAEERVAVTVCGRARWAIRPSARVVFTGGKHGDHSIDAYASDTARVLAHWEGYVAASLPLMPAVGAKVQFPSASAWRTGGYRTGRVVKVGPKRVTVAYTFKHGGTAAAKSVPITALRFG